MIDQVITSPTGQGDEIPPGPVKPLRVLLAGAGGTVGSAVEVYLTGQGHQVVRLVRPGTARTGGISWNPEAGTIDKEGLEGFDGVVQVASLPMARWTPDFMRRWYDNRVGTNRLLAEGLAGCKQKPQALVCASGQGIYVPSNEAVLTEDSPTGSNYLAKLLRDGEAATAPASEAGIRVAHLRIPTVIGGPTLAALVNGSRKGMRVSRYGNGRAWFSWVGQTELARIFEFVLLNDTLSGPINACSPYPVRNREFLQALGRAVGYKPWLPLPAFLMKLLAGGIAKEILLPSRRTQPHKLLEAGYQFRFPELEAALACELARLNTANASGSAS